MQIIDSCIFLDSRSQPVISYESYPFEETRTTQSRLSMIWLKESDGERQRLVTRWVTQN